MSLAAPAVAVLWALGLSSATLHGQPRPAVPSGVHTVALALPVVNVRAGEYTRLADLEAACKARATNPCLVEIGPQTSLQLTGLTRVPPGLQMHFADGAHLSLSGGTLDFAGGSIDAPADQQVFTGPGRVTGLREARPEWFIPAEAAGAAMPAAALAAAYSATMPHGTIRLNARAYVSPFVSLAQSISPVTSVLAHVEYNSPRTFIGAGRPLPDSDTAPTHLAGGTILLGQVVGSVPIAVEHLGIDDGPQVSATYFGGFVGHGLAMFGTGKLQGTGTRIEDVSVLTGAGESTHSIMVEGQSDATISGLWLWSLGGLHGLVIKSSHTTVSDFHCKGSAGDCLILKSDFATSRAGYAADDTLSGLYFSFLKTPGDTGGIVIDSTWDSVHDVSLSDVHLDGLKYGLSGGGSLFFTLRNLRLDGWTARNMRGRCVDLAKVRDVAITQFECGLDALPIGSAFMLEGAGIRLSDVRMGCSGDSAACAAAGTTGLELLSPGISLTRIQGVQLGGPVVRSLVPLSPEQIAQLRAMQGSGVLSAAYVAPHRSLGERLRKLKPPLRIVYEFVRTRLHEWPWRVTLTCLAALVAGIAVARCRRARSTLMTS